METIDIPIVLLIPLTTALATVGVLRYLEACADRQRFDQKLDQVIAAIGDLKNDVRGLNE